MPRQLTPMKHLPGGEAARQANHAKWKHIRGAIDCPGYVMNRILLDVLWG